MSRLKTGNNIYRAKIEEYILSCINSEDQELKTPAEKIKHFEDRFEREFNYENNRRRYPNLQDRIANYLMGLPFDFDFENYKILELVKRLHNVQELTEKEEGTVLGNYWNHLALHIIRLSNKYLN